MEEKENEVINEESVNNEQNSETKSNGMAVASMVLGLVGLIIFAIPCGILATVFAGVSKKKGKSGMATAGLVLGIIDIAFGAFYTVLVGSGVVNSIF